jgi:hypothetical protein
MAKECEGEAFRTWRCSGCAGIKPGTKEVDAIIQERKLDNTPLNFIFAFGLGVARRDFLFSFGEHEVQQHLYIGRIFSEDIGLLENWVTFHGKYRIFVRGSQHTQYRQCSECGRHLYFGLGKHYLYPQPDESVTMFYSGNGGLVVTGDLIERVTLNKWPKLKCEQLPVLSTPLDGLLDLRNP